MKYKFMQKKYSQEYDDEKYRGKFSSKDHHFKVENLIFLMGTSLIALNKF